MSNKKLCKDCKWITPSSNIKFALCGHDSAKISSGETGVSHITGEIMYEKSKFRFCSIHRKNYNGHVNECGIKGKYFEPKLMDLIDEDSSKIKTEVKENVVDKLFVEKNKEKSKTASSVVTKIIKENYTKGIKAKNAPSIFEDDWV